MKYICSIIIIQITVVVLFAGIAFAERNPKSLCTILEKAEIVVSGEIIKITGSDTIRGKHTATIKVSEILKGSLSGHEINFSWVTIDIVTSEQEPGRDIRIGTKGIWILGKEGNRDYLSMYFYTGYQSMEKIDDIKCLLTMGNERKKETPGSDLMLKIVNEYSKIPGLDKMYGYGKLDNIKYETLSFAIDSLGCLKGNDIAIAKPVLEKKYFSIRDRYLKRKILNTLVKFTEKGKKDESYKIFMGAFNSSEYFFPGIKGLERILGKKEVLLLLFDKLQNTSAGSKHVGSIVCAIDNYLWTMEGCCPPLKGYSKNPKRAWIEWWDKNKDRVIAETKKQWWQF